MEGFGIRNPHLDLIPSNIVAVDLDGVLLSKSDSLDSFGEFQSGVVRFVEFLHSSGYIIVIHTARPDLHKVVHFIERSPVSRFVSRVTNVKEDAVMFIDDRSYRFNNMGVFDFVRIFDILMYHKGYSFFTRMFRIFCYIFRGG